MSNADVFLEYLVESAVEDLGDLGEEVIGDVSAALSNPPPRWEELLVRASPPMYGDERQRPAEER